MSFVKPSYKSVEGIITIAVNIFSGIGVTLAYVANHHVFAANPNIDAWLGTVLLSYNGIFTLARTYLKAAALQADAIAATTATVPGIDDSQQ